MGRGGDGNQKKAQAESESSVNASKEVLIDGRLYDVTSLKHPGGSVIGFYTGNGIDASQAFNNFHIRSKKAKKYLDSLPSRPAPSTTLKAAAPLPGQQALLADFDELTRQLEAEGFFKPAPMHVAYRLLELLVLYGAGFYLMSHGQVLLGIVLAAIAQGRCGWLMHEGGHYSLTGNINIDRAIQVRIIYATTATVTAVLSLTSLHMITVTHYLLSLLLLLLLLPPRRLLRTGDCVRCGMRDERVVVAQPAQQAPLHAAEVRPRRGPQHPAAGGVH